MTSNIFTITQTVIIRHPKVKEALGIPQMKQWKDTDLPMNKLMSDVMAGKRAKDYKEDPIEALAK